MNKTRMKNGALLTMIAGTLLQSCGSGEAQPSPEAAPAETTATEGVVIEEVALTTPLDQDMVAAGKKIYELKCQSCHRLSNEKLVGPGWKGITERRKPGWIMAMTTRPDVMLEKDPTAQKLLEEHLVKMPNQNVTNDEARQLLEFMRFNDETR